MSRGERSPITIELDGPSALRPGDELRATIRWTLDEAPRGGAVVLRWRSREQEPGSTEPVDFGDALRIELERLPSRAARGPAAGAEDPYRRGAQADAGEPLVADDVRELRTHAPTSPYSYEGTLFRIDWLLVVEIPGLPDASVELVIAPNAEPVRIVKPESDDD